MKTFDQWFYEIEVYSTRACRLFSDECKYSGELYERIKPWLMAAYDAGVENRKEDDRIQKIIDDLENRIEKRLNWQPQDTSDSVYISGQVAGLRIALDIVKESLKD